MLVVGSVQGMENYNKYVETYWITCVLVRMRSFYPGYVYNVQMQMQNKKKYQ